MLYTKTSIDRVREADLLQVISHYVQLKQTGSVYKGLSPFQNENTPSFIVSKAKNIWKCFASGKGGNDPISFVMQNSGATFPDAVKTIAEICNIHVDFEDVSEEVKEQINTQQKIKALNTNVAEEYARQFSKLPKNHWAKKHLEGLGYTQDEIIMFQIGFAPGNLVSKAVVKNAKLDIAVSAGLVKTKNGASYDFFFDRIIFPIHDKNNQVIAFGGRCSREAPKEYPKYLNSPSSDVFNKSKALYGLRQARHSIVKNNEAILVEGYTDVISLHKNGADNAVATCGTALTKDHADVLKKLADHIIIFRDGDTAGIKAAQRDIEILLATGKKISVILCPDGEDPDSLSRKEENIEDYISKNLHDAVEWKAKTYLEEAGENSNDKVLALKKTVETLANIPSELTRKEYYKTIAKLYKHSTRDIAKEVKQVIAKREEEFKRMAKRQGLTGEDFLGLPKGATLEDYKENGHAFVTVGNAFHVRSKEGWMKATDFKLTPLFHVEGDKDTTRLFDIVNERGEKALVEMESSLLLNQTQNQNRLLDYGVYMWHPELSGNNFKLIMSQLIRRFIKVKPFSYFGWQSKGFWAYANGVYTNGEFQKVNEYGIVEVEGLEKIESDYYNNTSFYYSPAFNITNKHKEDDLDLYQNDRAFVFKKSPITFNTWMQQMVKVYDEKANIAISFTIASMFKDLIMSRYSYFPLLYCSGEKGSGKSAFANSIANLFTYKQQPFQIDSGSKVGFFRRLQRGRNTATVMEEYHDKIDPEKFQALKGAWDGRGREIGMMSNDSRTKVSDVRCSLIIVGQYLSSRDDNSLTSRSLIQRFIKPTEQFEDQKIRDYNQLLEWEEQGLTSMVLDVVKHRNVIEANFHEAFYKNARAFKKALKKFEYQERMLQNYNAIYTPIALLKDVLSLPFTIEEFFQQCVESIIDNSDLLIESEGLSEFWNVIGKLAENSRIRPKEHFEIETPLELKLFTRRNEAETTWHNTERKQVLFLRLTSVHQDYADVASKRDGVDVIGEATLRTYFKSKRYYIGAIKSKRFSNISSSCYAFDYDLMAANGILNIAQGEVVNPTIPEKSNNNASTESDNDELPF